MTTKKKSKSPTQLELIEPTFSALVELGGSATIGEIYECVVQKLRLPEEAIDEPHRGRESRQTELEYQLAWARTWLKNYGAICNSKRGVWMITPAFADRTAVSRSEVTKRMRWADPAADTDGNGGEHAADADMEPPTELEPWKTELADILHRMDPYAFERLAMLLLRECGFSQVRVTRKSGDGGIDGIGKLRINGIFSFRVAFQCKRYSGSVSTEDIRAFRGSLTTDIEKGVFITTGTFTHAAREEASLAGKQQIDLIDGTELIDKLIECRLGVTEKTIFEVERAFFERI